MKALQVDGLPDVLRGETPDALPSHTVRFWFSGRPAPERASNGMVTGAFVNNYFWVSTIQRPFIEWADATGGSAIECHQYGAIAEEAEGLSDAVLLDRCRRDVERIWPGVAGTCIHQHLLRSPPGHPDFRQGVWSRLPRVRTELPNLTLCGDWIDPDRHSFFLERCASTGLEAARSLALPLGLDVNAIPPLLEPHPPSAGFEAYRTFAQALRRRGLLPSLDR